MSAAAAERPQHWSGMAEIGSAFGITFLFWVYRLLGRLPFRLVLVPVALYFFLFKAQQRKASEQFIARAAAAGAKIAPTPYSSFRHFLAFGDAMLDKLIAWNGGLSFSEVDFQGYEAVRAKIDNGQGFLLIGSHLGNLEVCRVLSQQRAGLRLRVLVHTRHAQNFNRMMARLNPDSAVSLMQVTDLGVAEAAELSAWIAGGGVVLIAGDRVPVARSANGPAPRVTQASFLGHDAPFPQGPLLLASVLGCPVFLLFCLRRGRRFEATFEAFAERVNLPRRERERTLGEWTQRFASRLEQFALSAPLQWFNFFPFWNTTSSAHETRNRQ